jgi:chemotaxis family two-component system response regulator Rcp1
MDCVVLLAEDNSGDVHLFRQAFTDHGVNPHLVVASDGGEAMLLMDQIDDGLIPCPALIVLDLNLPKRNGFDVLKRVKVSPKCCNTTVIILSSSDSKKERDEASRLGAARYLKKPSDLDEFEKVGDQLISALHCGKSV